MPVDLEEALTALAASLEFPGESEMAARVVAELSGPAQVVPLRRRPVVRRLLAVAAAAIVIVGAVLAGSPRARRAVADLLGIGGIEIQSSSPGTEPGGASTAPPTFPTTLAPDRLGLGSAIAVDEGAERVGVAAPVPDVLGPPAAAYLTRPPSAPKLTLVWEPSAMLPSTSIPDVGALLTVFEAGIDEGLFKKLVGTGTTYERVTVDGSPAVWLSGEPHSFLYLAPGGTVAEETLRLAGNTLIWTRGPYTYRLESALSRDAAIAVAESVPAR